MPAYNPKRDSAGREIPDDHFEAIFGHLAKDARRAVLFARTTGCRKREVASLDWRAHWSAEGFRPIVQKGSSPRVVSYDAAILGPRRPGGLVFGELAGTVPEIYQRLTAAWRYAVKAAKVPHYRFHDLRHTYGTILRREGKTFSDLAAIMGISEAMAHVYAHEDTEKLQREAIEAKLCTNSALSALARLA
jgi:integrase